MEAVLEAGDFFHAGQSQARDLFWDFLKNFSLACGFLLLSFGTTSQEMSDLFTRPLPSTMPYVVQTH